MSTNPLNDISKVYLEQVVESSHLETDMKKRAEENEKARKKIMKTKAHNDMVAAARKKFDEGVDQDKDGDTDFADIMIARMKASGQKTQNQAVAATKDKTYNKKSKTVTKEGYSNWRQDLSEVITSEIADKEIKEKKVNNKIKTSAVGSGIKLGEAVEGMGGTLLEMVEIDEFDFIVESAYDELLNEGYNEDEIEEALEYALTEAKVTFGHDTPAEKKRSGLLAAARTKLSAAKATAKATVARGARKVAKGALGVARKIEAGNKKPSTAERKPSTYRGAGAGTKERVSSGSYTPPAKKKAEKPADPWEGSATTPSKPKAKTKKPAAPKAKAPASAPKRKRKSKLDDLLASVRSESVKIDEKTLTAIETKKKEELVKSMKKNAADFEKRYPGRGKEVMYATATKMAKRMAEDIAIGGPSLTPTPTSSGTSVQQKKSEQNRQKEKQLQLQILQRKMQALRSSTSPSISV